MRTFTALVTLFALLFATASAIPTIPTIRQDAEESPEASPTVAASPVSAPVDGLGMIPDGLEPSESEEPSESPEDDDPICFPAHATVQREDGSVVRMDKIQVGDRVKVAQDTFSEVFMFTHRLADVDAKFVKISAADRTLELTEGHYLYVNGHMTAAKAVKEGDSLEIEGSCATVNKVEIVSGKGLYNPQTLHGDIVVNGVKASTYTTAVEPTVAHWLLAPMRGLYKAVGFSTAAFDKGNHGLAALAPRGQVSY